MSSGKLYARWLRFWYTRPLPYAVTRFAASLLPGPQSAVTTLKWFRMDLDPHDLLEANIMLTVWDAPLSRWLAYLASISHTLFDVGGHCGYFSLIMQHFAPPDAQIHTFEPNASLHARFRHNLELNQAMNVRLNPQAVSDHIGSISLYVRDTIESGTTSTHPIFAYDHIDSVQTITLDAYCDELQIDQVDLIKIDVEGHEDAVLRGMQQGLAGGRYGIIVLEGHPSLLTASQVENMLKVIDEAGYARYNVVKHTAIPMTDKTLPHDHILIVHPNYLASLKGSGSGTLLVPDKYQAAF